MNTKRRYELIGRTKTEHVPPILAYLFICIFIFIGNAILSELIYSITKEDPVSINIARYFDFYFYISGLCYALALCISIRYTKSKKISFMFITMYFRWLYLLKYYVTGMPMDITIHLLLILHILSTTGIYIVCSIAIYLIDHPQKARRIFICMLIAICLIFIDLKIVKNSFCYWLLSVNSNVRKWNEFGFNSKHIDNNITGHACPIFIDNRIIPWFDILPNRWANFYLGLSYYCKAKEFCFIDFDTDTLIIHCDESESKIYFGSDYLSEYEVASRKRFEGNHLGQFKNWQSKQLRPGLTVRFEDNKVHTIDLLKLSTITDYKTEMLTIECGTEKNTHFIPHRTFANKTNSSKQQLNDTNLPSSVLIFILDSTSRHDFHRKLLKSASVIEKISRNIPASHQIYEFMRYAVVRHSTSGNLGPLFHGDWSETIFHGDWSETIANQNGFTTSLMWDECTAPFYWDNAFHNNSDFAPDFINMVGCEYSFDFYGNSGFINNGKGSITLNDKCNHQKMAHQHMLEYQTLLHKWKNQTDVFSISHTQIGHDGVGVSIIAIDDYLSEWIQQHVIDSNVFDDTLILIMSDHGMHFGVPSLTDIGELEHHLGTMIWLYPKKRMNEEIDEILRHNEQSLVTVWDFRNTLLSLINPNDISVRSVSKGQNILKEHVPYSRTCEDASISDLRCMCMHANGNFKFFAQLVLARLLFVTMYTYREQEPLISTKDDNKCKRIGSILFTLSISCIVIVLFAYNSSIISSANAPNASRILNDELDTDPNTKPPLNSLTAGKSLKSSLSTHEKIFGQEKIETIIRFEAESNPYEEFWMSYDEWNKFHSDLVDEQGYDMNDKDRSFVFEINDGKKETTLKAQSSNNAPKRCLLIYIISLHKTHIYAHSNLECFTRYAYTEGNKDSLEPGATVGVNCLDADRQGAAQMVGCVTFHPDNYGYTSGETIGWLDIVGPDGKIRTEPRCKSWHREGAEIYRFPIGVAARCCRASEELKASNPYQEPLYVNYGMFFNAASYYDRHNGHCFHSLDKCNNVEKGMDRGPEDGSVAVLCTTYYGQWIGYGDAPGCNEHSVPESLDCGGWTGKPFGTRYDPMTGCQTGRGEAGYIAQRMGCAGSTKGSMTCMWEEAQYAVLNSNTMQWHSRVECPDGYALADCNGFVDAVNFQQCSHISGQHQRGISYGAFYSHTDEKSTACIAVGSKNDIRAQASCCRIAQ